MGTDSAIAPPPAVPKDEALGGLVR